MNCNYPFNSLMDTNMLTPTVTPLIAGSAQNHSLSTDPKRVVQFSFGQTGIRECVPFLIDRENVT